MTIVRVIDFTHLPGPRHISDGPDSGELFRRDFLEEPFLEAVKTGAPLEVDLDGTKRGYPPSFLEESFGGLARIWTAASASPRLSEAEVVKLIRVKSNDTPIYVDFVRQIILDANKIRAKKK